MNEARARVLRDLISEYDTADILEIGFCHGKSSAYIAAILEDRGRGSLLTIDRRVAEDRKPNIHDLLREAQLTHRVEPRFAFRSFTWELARLLIDGQGPRFDFCYFDGGHAWDETGFGFTLVDQLLRPGGVILFDDMDWSIANSAFYRTRPKLAAPYSEDERAARTVRLVWDTLVPAFGYTRIREIPEFSWGLARKDH